MAQKQKQVSFFKKWTPNRVYTESFLNSVLRYLNIQDKRYIFMSGVNFNYKDFIDLGYSRFADYSSKDVEDIMLDVLHNIDLESHMLTLVESIALVLTNLKINYKYAGEGICFNGILPVEVLYKGYCNLQAFFNKYNLPYMVPDLSYKEFLNNLKDESAFYEIFIRSKADRNKNKDCIVPIEFNWRSMFDTHGRCKVTRDTQVPFFTLRTINNFYFVVIDNDTIYGNRIFNQLESFVKIIFNSFEPTHNYDYSLFITNCKPLITKTDMLKSISKISIGKVGRIYDSIYLMENQRNNEDCEYYYDELKILIKKQRRNIFTPEINYRIMVVINELANRYNYKFRFKNCDIKPQIKEKDIWDEVKKFKESEEKDMTFGKNEEQNKEKKDQGGEQKQYLNKSLRELDKSLGLVSSTIKSLRGSLDTLEGTLSTIKGRCDTLEEEFKKKYGESTLKEFYEKKDEEGDLSF